MAIDSNNLCQFKNCDKKYIERCEYCDKKYCKSHISPSLILSLNQIINEPNEAKRNVLRDEYDKEDVHPCPAYTQNFWKDWYTDKNSSSNAIKLESNGKKEREDSDITDKSDNSTRNNDSKTVSTQNNSKIKISLFKKNAHNASVKDNKPTQKIEEEVKTDGKSSKKKGFLGNIKDSLVMDED